ncbi:MAG: O-antigen ligase family protein [Pirellulales bacterium]
MTRQETAYDRSPLKLTPTPHLEKRSGIEASLMRVIDGCLLGIIFVAPYLLGGRHAVGQFVFVSLALLMAVAWLALQCMRERARWVRSPVEWLLLAGAILIVTQIVPLPQNVVQQISPHQAHTLQSWSTDLETQPSMGAWPFVSLTPSETREGLAVYIAYALLFLVITQRLRTMNDLQRVLRWIGLSAILMAACGLVQYLTSNGKFLWVYEHPFRTTSDVVKGSFANQNHFAHFLALGLGPLAFWIVTKIRRERRSADTMPLIVLTIGFGGTLFAGLMTLSRGGAIAMSVALLVCAIVFYRSALLDRRYFVGATIVGMLVLASLLIHGSDRVANRLNDLTSVSFAEVDSSQARRLIWQANLETTHNYMLLGSGVGSHRYVYPLFLEKYFPVVFSHAESGFLQVASETGLIGLALLFIGIGFCIYWCVSAIRHARSPTMLACAGAISASLAASVTHSVIDFIWYVPACMSITVILIACSLRLWHFSREPEHEPNRELAPRRGIWCALMVTVLVVTVCIIRDCFGPAVASIHWNRYLRTSAKLTATLVEQQTLNQYETVAHDGQTVGLTLNAIRHLENVLYWNPHHARAQIRIAGKYLHRFEQLQQTADNVMSLTDIREAAFASKFSSRAALNQWLGRAIGDQQKLLEKASQHCRAALHLCPLFGNGYVYLAELCFLEGGSVKTKAAYIAQALKVRPHDGAVLFAAGKEAILTGNIPKAIGFWKKSFHRGGEHQQRMISLLAGRVPFQFIAETFEPDLPALRSLYLRYRQLGAAPEMTAVAALLSDTLMQKAQQDNSSEAGILWLESLELNLRSGHHDHIRLCAARALAAAPNDLATRRAVGEAMLALREFDEAEKQLRWCVQQKPGDKRLQNLLRSARHHDITSRSHKHPPTDNSSQWR